MSTKTIVFNLNGKPCEAPVGDNELLVDFLREKLHLTGTKVGCGVGECGACTVLVDGKPINSCLTLAATIHGKQLVTIEGVAQEHLHPLQQAFIEEGAVQCGFCTPGMILSAKALLDARPRPGEKEIKEAISGNLCRCTGYASIIRAIQKVAGTEAAAPEGPNGRRHVCERVQDNR